MKKRVVTIFGSGLVAEKDKAYEEARTLGRILAENGFTVCNGGYRGIMEASAHGAKEAGGKTIGITARELGGEANAWIDEKKCVETWRDRLFSLIDIADAYVVLDGATGTLTELFTVWEMTNKKLLAKPIVLFGPKLNTAVEKMKEDLELKPNEFLKNVFHLDGILPALK